MQEVAFDKPLVGRIREFFTKHPELHQKDMAKALFMSDSQLSKLLNGSKFSSLATRVRLVHWVKDILVSWSAARIDFGLPSFMFDRRRTGDLLGLLCQEEKESREREEIQAEYLDALTTTPISRTARQTQLIEMFPKELLEDIGAKQALFAKICEESDKDPQPFIDAYNKQYGG
ncbi:hypothetical protein LL936_05445 [Levilactobacillus brevis]|uniref:Uncharacterized protein n=2 Tax=Levilactobacillus brevis TaxID=1580 RepID=A0AAJ5FIZ9_LEVBR|nr:MULTISPECIES: hypothetical protein [Levilactobacillus]MBU7539545.1 hypothetical protein [Levilactobacillus brevis]MBU7559174.1 hypothetical protein [Levilactobacillus brevis]MBU7565716.1 hypothetical protein [Levilactobacillus brevis]MCE6010708.1 hypothetical protein [Levilactobacillus brevis]MCE6012997.1 hypothetical protein [Levilactobacillus brevis]